MSGRWTQIYTGLTAAVLLYGCGETTSEPQEAGSRFALKEGSRGASVTVVAPSTAADPGTKAQEDWDNINAALQDAGPGEVVELQAGLFYLHKSIVRYDFSGTLRGAGVDLTTVQTAPGAVFDVSGVPSLVFAFDFVTEGHGMFVFPQNFTKKPRNVVVSDLTFLGTEPTTDWARDLNGTQGAATIHNSLMPVVVYYVGLDTDLTTTIPLSITYRSVKAQGVEDLRFNSPFGTHYSLATGLGALGASRRDVVVEDVQISHATTGLGLHVWNATTSMVSVAESRISNAFSCIDSQVNDSWSVSDNELECSRRGLLLIGPHDGTASAADVWGNQFLVTGGPAVVGLQVHDATVRDNVVVGSGFAALVSDGGAGWQVVDNDLCGHTPFSGASVFLVGTTDTEIRDNAGQIVGGPSAADPSNAIGDAVACPS